MDDNRSAVAVVTLILPVTMINDVKKIAKLEDDHDITVYRRAILEYTNRKMFAIRDSARKHPTVLKPLTEKALQRVYSRRDAERAAEVQGEEK